MSSRRRSEAGFTLIELLTVTIVITLLAALGLLKFRDVRNAARAAEVAGDVRSVMVASYNYHADRNTWPPDAGPGAVPAGLEPYLPGGYSFTKKAYTMEYENVGVGGGKFLVGVTITSPDAGLMNKLIRVLGNRGPFFVAGGSLTYVISGAD